MRDQLRVRFLTVVIVLLIISPVAVLAQAPTTSGITTEETQPPFLLRAERNLVLVRVVVRDRHGRFVGNLKAQNFELLDNGKPQTITHFSIEHPAAGPSSVAASAPSGNQTAPPAQAERAKSPEAPPQRFLALLFDDVHASQGDLNQVSAAAVQYLATAMHPGERVGVFTTSRFGELDFSNDAARIQAAIKNLAPHPRQEPRPCPDVSPYEAYLITEMNDPDATSIAYGEMVRECATIPRGMPGAARAMGQQLHSYLQARAREILNYSEGDARQTFNAVSRVVERLAERPGERTLLLVSPGFFDRTVDYALDPVIDNALRQGIVVNALNPLGLAPSSVFSAEKKTMPEGPELVAAIRIKQEASDANEEPLLALVDGTGGTFFHNSNNYLAGFRATAEPPEVYYLLAFTPAELKYDGKFHKLQVKLAEAQGLSVQARRGYFAPREAPSEAQQTEEQIRAAMFSTGESNTIPLAVSTKFFKPNSTTARLTVVVRIDPRALSFRTDQDRKVDRLTVTSVLFDETGRLVEGKQKIVKMRLLDSTLTKMLASHSGLETSLDFDVAPGSYRLREIVHESNSNRISAVNRELEVP